MASVTPAQDRGGPGIGAGTTAEPYAGERLGLPRDGSRSLAPLWRRLVAILLDWAMCTLIASSLLGYRNHAGGLQAFVPLAVFAAENVLLVATTGATLGHRLLGLRVLQVRPGPYPVQVVVRTLLLCLFLPAVFSDKDGRGFHDRIAGTVIVRR